MGITDQSFNFILLGLVCVLLIITLILQIVHMVNSRSKYASESIPKDYTPDLAVLKESNDRIEKQLKDDLLAIKTEQQVVFDKFKQTLAADLKEKFESFNKQLKDNNNQTLTTQKDNFDGLAKKQEEFTSNTHTKLNEMRNTVDTKLEEKFISFNNRINEDSKKLQDSLKITFDKIEKLQLERFDNLDKRQTELVTNTEKKLDTIRNTVDEKLDKTLTERLGQTFKTVGEQLDNVQKGLGEMQTLAKDVGGLKNALTNVKIRGIVGEVQLEMLLSEILAPNQYEKQANINDGNKVDFVIKLPEDVLLPIDAKFPNENYKKLQEAYEKGEKTDIDYYQKELEKSFKQEAKTIFEKYIDPPKTTDFAILYVPFEGLFAEVVRKSSFFEDLQKNYHVTIAGPSTIVALLSSLQMGFKTLAVQKYSSEIMNTLGKVKNEFGKFGGMLGKAQRNIKTGLNQLDVLSGTRINAITSALKNVTTDNEGLIDSNNIISLENEEPEINDEN